MKNQKEFIKAWYKMMINSSFGYPPVPIIGYEYDENKKLKITEEGKKNLKLLQDILKKYGIQG